ncbi:(2Fe-2S)-binding protein [Alphaproteobacteria bacterium]|nr:(2Fe-2S)-binding protein [Alphaproteobacteria bacterium]
MKSAEKPLCYCFNVSHDDIDAFFADGIKTYDEFVKETRIGTKCTACLLDLDVYLDTVFKNRKLLSLGNIEAFEEKPKGFLTYKSFVDSGFCLPKNIAETSISLQKFDQCFSSKNLSVVFNYQLNVYSNSGGLVDVFKGDLASNKGVDINISQKLNADDGG